MKRYEKESLLKNFFVFFILLELLLLLLFTELYHTQKREYKQNLFKTMYVCNYTMECSQFTYDFVDKDKNKLNELFDDNGLHSYFPIPTSEKYYMEISYPQKRYNEDIQAIQNILWVKFILATLLLFGIALFFTFYSLRPIRKALQLNDEFIKDILHDFNTPITSMILNIKMFKEEKGEDIFIKRIFQGINNIMLLQNNLKCFLQHSPSQNEPLDIARLAKERLEQMQESYPLLTFTYEKNNNLICMCNEKILTRIFDNLLSNASKYNKSKGEVKVIIKGTSVLFQDTGKGIQNINKVMQRYYKEQERGLGLGLHIVQKLIDELNIEMHITSEVGAGSTFTLDFKHLEKA
ncbi:MAG: HAMP domain-containing histidine kinase [Epsilonproteobacteria bacterium]|nr:HAMP domain-containing histidine kinase [Campylobacterota bacterium]